jgi:hypothetical protein
MFKTLSWSLCEKNQLPHRISMDAHNQKIAQSFGVSKQGHMATVKHIPSAIHIDHLQVAKRTVVALSL